MFPRRFTVHTADPQLLPGHAHLLQAAKNVLGHAFGQIDKAVIVTDVHLPDVTPFQPRLVSNRANDVARFNPMRVTDFQAEGLKHNIVGIATLAARSSRTSVTRWATVATSVTIRARFALTVCRTFGMRGALAACRMFGARPALAVRCTFCARAALVVRCTFCARAALVVRCTFAARAALAACRTFSARAALTVCRALSTRVAPFVYCARTTLCWDVNAGVTVNVMAASISSRVALNVSRTRIAHLNASSDAIVATGCAIP